MVEETFTYESPKIEVYNIQFPASILQSGSGQGGNGSIGGVLPDEGND